MQINHLVLDNVEGVIKVRFGLEITPESTLLPALGESGELKLTCRAQIGLRRDFFWNQQLARGELSALIVKNSQGGYSVNLSGKNFSAESLGQALRKAFSEVVIDLGAWRNLRRGENYAVQLELRLTRENPSSMSKALFFLNWDVAPAVRYQLDFSY